MKLSRPFESDAFVRRPFATLRTDVDRNAVAAEADVAGLEPFMEATIAAAMLIAHADGHADLAERRRFISLFRANRLLAGFSADDIAREIASHAEAFALDAPAAVKRAQAQIAASDLTDAEFRALTGVCVSVIEADGVRHPAEENALAEILALRAGRAG